jgi:hypothetical protein
MKTVFHSFGLSAALLLTCFSVLVHSFPTAANLVKLADESDITPETLGAAIETLKKRQTFNALTTPISGEQYLP